MNPTFPLTLEFKFSLLTELRVTDAQGQLIAVVKEKLFSIRDEVRVYSDEGRTRQTHGIRARGLMAGALDWRARREIRRVDGSSVGALQAHGLRTLWAAGYDLLGPDERTEFTIRDDQPWMSLVEGVLDAIPFIGNLIVGKFADQHAIGILRIGHTLLFISLALLGAFSNAQPLVLAMVLIVGVAGVPMNPAMVARVAEIGGTGNMVSTVHTSVITMGVALGSAIGALAIGRAGDDPSAAMWIGAAFAVLATLTLATQARGRRQPLRPPHATETVDCV